MPTFSVRLTDAEDAALDELVIRGVYRSKAQACRYALLHMLTWHLADRPRVGLHELQAAAQAIQEPAKKSLDTRRIAG